MKKWKGKTRWLAILLSLCMVVAVIPITAFAATAAQATQSNIIPAFAGEQMVSVGYGDFEEPHYFELLENDELKVVTGSIIEYQIGETPYYSYDSLKAYLSECTAGNVINCRFAFQGDGDYADFRDIGTLTFTMVGGVDEVRIEIDAPQTGKTLAETASVLGSSSGVAVADDCLVVSEINWAKSGESAGASNGTTAAANTKYTASFVLHTDRGVAFADNVVNEVKVKVNGVSIDAENVQVNYVNESYQLEFFYEFDETGAAPVIDQVNITIDAPQTGKPLATIASVTSCSANGVEVDTSLLTVKSVEWGEPCSTGWIGGTTPTTDTVAAANKVYTVTIELTSSDVTFKNEGYDYSGITTTVNGQSAIPYTMDLGARCAVTYTFDETGAVIENPVIDLVNVTIDAPQTGKPLAQTAIVTASADGVAVDSSLFTYIVVTWFEFDDNGYPILTSDKVAVANKKYAVTVTVSGEMFQINTKYTVNGKDWGYAGLNEDLTICYLSCVFDKAGDTTSDTIKDVNIAVASPIIGCDIEKNEPYAYITDSVQYKIDSVKWIKGTYPEVGDSFEDPVTGTFEADTWYYAEIFISVNNGYTFDSDLSITVNGQSPAEVFAVYGGTDTHFIAKIKAVESSESESDYKIIEGANGSWTQNSDGTLTFRANGDFSKFTGVKVDGTLIDASNYTAVSGSTVITLKTDYLKTLSVGTHKLTVVYTDGDCSTNFEIKAASSGSSTDDEKDTTSTCDKTDTTQQNDGKTTESPKTGDDSNLMLWFVVLFASIAGVIGTVTYGRKKKCVK